MHWPAVPVTPGATVPSANRSTQTVIPCWVIRSAAAPGRQAPAGTSVVVAADCRRARCHRIAAWRNSSCSASLGAQVNRNVTCQPSARVLTAASIDAVSPGDATETVARPALRGNARPSASTTSTAGSLDRKVSAPVSDGGRDTSTQVISPATAESRSRATRPAGGGANGSITTSPQPWANATMTDTTSRLG